MFYFFIVCLYVIYCYALTEFEIEVYKNTSEKCTPVWSGHIFYLACHSVLDVCLLLQILSLYTQMYCCRACHNTILLSHKLLFILFQ